MNPVGLLLSLFLGVSLAARQQAGGHRPRGEGRTQDAKHRRDGCNPEKAQARCVKIVQEWWSYVNTGNIQYLINHYMQVGASVTTTGAVNTNLCNLVAADLGQSLAADVAAGIKGDVLTIKEVKYLPRTGQVEVHFTGLEGVGAVNMTMVDNKWLFKSHSGCDYRVADQQNTFFPCL